MSSDDINTLVDIMYETFPIPSPQTSKSINAEVDLLLVPPPCLLNLRQLGPGVETVPEILTTVTATATATTETTTTVEKALRNGDLYTGELSGGVPHGSGKYLWCDGCMYEGSWARGKACGKGRFSWPSGATYEGEFEEGRMDGHGTFIGVDGDTYRGWWVSGRKDGSGEKWYANGDHYEGEWKSNLQEGEGKYVWSDGNEYVGEWKNGLVCGRGVLRWANGNRYEGFWENGVPKGKGMLTFSNGVTHSGSWGMRDESEFPRICIWELDGEAGDITCDIVANLEASMFYRDENDNGNDSDCDEVKKPGQTVSIGDKHYDLMLNLQLGIRYAVGKHASTTRELRPTDFDPKQKYWTRFPPEGSNSTRPHQSIDFKWKDYCPLVFRHLRGLFAIDPADYMLAICGNDSLRAFSSPGKSGSSFYLTQDQRFVIKTVKKSEVKVLIKMLPNYYQHVCLYKNTLVTKFFGVHCVKPVGGQKTRFIVMGNLFCSEYRIHKRFDLKGSSHGRTIDKPEGEIDETTTLKDLDLNYTFLLENSWYQELIKQIDRDCELLERERIMDYSLLIGVHFCDDCLADRMSPKTPIFSDNGDDHKYEVSLQGYQLLPHMDWNTQGRAPLIRLGANTPARAERGSRTGIDQQAGGESSHLAPGEIFDAILYFGIIDILQDYDISKKLEHAYKSLHVDPSSISAVDPKLYSKRFRDFVQRIFVEDKL